ncbi:hypothetical protein AGMMS49938_12240 [Fibrobacterales bacterium]|nr:hypothetical protein AGMMS49938_12240 [Fibrobacterales bacterium]
MLSLSVIAVVVNWIALPIIAGHLVTKLEVPNVTGLSAEDAEANLIKAGLSFKWADSAKYSAVVPAKHTLLQIPAAGRTVKENRTIFLTLSKGKQEVKVPATRGQSIRQVEISLQRLGLILGKNIEGAHSGIPRGAVIRTEPDSGAVVRIGDKVNIVVSSGNSNGKILLPNLREMSLEKAQAAIDSLGFSVGEISSMPIDDKLPNTVLEHNPKSGEYLDAGTKINLVVAE